MFELSIVIRSIVIISGVLRKYIYRKHIELDVILALHTRYINTSIYFQLYPDAYLESWNSDDAFYKII